MRQDIIDISVRLNERTVTWPDDPSVRITQLADLDEDGVRVSELAMSVHTATHVDAPTHYLESGPTIDEAPFDALMGPCVVLDLANAGPRIEADDLAGFDLRPGERVLLRTQSSSRHLWAKSEFAEDFAHLTPEAAAHLAARQIRCVGIDYLSIGGMEDGVPTHETLMNAGIWIIEGLDLRGVQPGEYELVCLPLRLEGLEAAPARALLRKLEGTGTPDFVDDAVEYASKLG